MSKLNMKYSPIFTHEGAKAKHINHEQQLRRSVMACMLWEKTFYEDGIDVSARIAGLVPTVKPETVAAIAVEAREKMKLRHTPLFVVREMARHASHKGLVGRTLSRVIQRADELAEFLAIYWKDGRRPLSAQVKKGLAEAFKKFNAYQLAKYNRDGAIKLRDVLFLCHAKPKDDEQAALWKQLVENTLPVPDTWEVALSDGADKKEAWTRLLAENKIGALALLRNLRNMQSVGVSDAKIENALATMKASRVLPFRFIAAARHAPQIEPAIEEAMLKCLGDHKKLPGKTILLVDCSGSMEAKLSGKSDITRFDAAKGVAILLREVCEVVAIVGFSGPFKHKVKKEAFCSINGEYVSWMVDGKRPGVALVPPRRGFSLSDAISSSTARNGTETESGKAFCDSLGYDRIVIITDEQSSQSLSDPKGKGYVINVASCKNGVGYGAWTHIDGWSEAVVDYIMEFERDAEAVQKP